MYILAMTTCDVIAYRVATRAMDELVMIH